MSSHQEHTDEEVTTLFERLEAKFPTEGLGQDKWYLVATSALTGGGKAELVGKLYSHLIQKPQYAGSTARQALVRRLRETLVKCVPIIGVCKPLEAVFSISALERDEDKDYSFSREHWKSGAENHERGVAWLNQIYQRNRGDSMNPMAAHKDFAWISTEITYGLFLSDHSILGPVDTELVVLSGIMIQNLNRETGWHIRGTRRVGASQEDVEAVYQCIKDVADFAKVSLDKVPLVADIEHEV